MKVAEQRIRTRTAEIRKDEYGILWIVPVEGSVLDKEDILDNLLVVRHLSDSQPALKMVDTRNRWKIRPGAELSFKKEDSPDKTIARAVLVKSRTARFIKSFFVRVLKPEIPIDFFTTEQKAIKWLLSFRK